MSQNDTIGFKDILHYLGILLLGLFLFYAFIYYFNGNIIFSAVSTLIAVALLGMGLTYMLVRLKTVTEHHKKYYIYEMLVLIVGYMLIFTFSTGYFLSKLVVVEFANKQEIQDEALNQVEEIEDLFYAYRKHVDDKRNNYNEELKNKRESQNSIDSKLISLDESLLDSEFLMAESEANEYMAETKQIIIGWNRLKLPKVLTETSRLKENWYNLLVEKSGTHTETNEFGSFSYSFKYDKTDNLLNPPLTNVNWLIVGLVLVIIHLLILWPYLFFAKRSTRPVGYVKDTGLKI